MTAKELGWVEYTGLVEKPFINKSLKELLKFYWVIEKRAADEIKVQDKEYNGDNIGYPYGFEGAGLE